MNHENNYLKIHTGSLIPIVSSQLNYKTEGLQSLDEKLLNLSLQIKMCLFSLYTRYILYTFNDLCCIHITHTHTIALYP